jgi:hypothetical protein
MLAQIKRVIQLGQGYTHEIVSDRVSFIRQGFTRPGKNGRTSKIRAFYIGTDSWVEAQAIARSYRGRCIIREASRVTDWDYEVKFQGDFNEEEILEIAEELESRFRFMAQATIAWKKSLQVPSAVWRGTLDTYKAPVRHLDQRRRNALFA